MSDLSGLGVARDTVHSMERDVLEQWRTAVSASDETRVGELVQLAHSLRDVGNALTIGGESEMSET